jgi:hypothetical protein
MFGKGSRRRRRRMTGTKGLLECKNRRQIGHRCPPQAKVRQAGVPWVFTIENPREPNCTTRLQPCVGGYVNAVPVPNMKK